MSRIDTILTLIAQKHLGIETLQTGNADSFDFRYRRYFPIPKEPLPR